MGRVYLTDFGLANAAAGDSTFTRPGQALGTPAYMSPEQARGERDTLGPPTDVWGLGCVLYELLAGRPAFEGLAPAALAVASARAPLARLAQVRPDLPRALHTVVTGALAAAPAGRYPSARALCEDCERVLRGAAASGPRRRRRPVFVAAAAAAVLLPVALLAAILRPGPAVGSGPSDAALESRAEQAWGLRVAEPARAAATLRDLLAGAPDRQDWRLRLGLLAWAARDIDGAQRLWRAVPEHDAAATRARWLRGLAALADALDAHRDRAPRETTDVWAAATAGSGPESRWAQAGLLYLRGDKPGALAMLADARGWEAAALRGLIRAGGPESEGTDPAGRRSDWEQVLAEGMPFAWAYLNRGVASFELGDIPRAIADYDAALARHPDHPEALFSRAGAKGVAGDLAGALDDLGAAIRAVPDWSAPWRERAKARLALAESRAVAGDAAGAAAARTAALADGDTAVRLAPTEAVSVLIRGNARIALGDVAGAIADYGVAMSLDPADAIAVVNRGAGRRRMGDLAGARADFDTALVRNPRCAEAFTGRGELRRAGDDPAGALADYDAAIAIRPGLADAYEGRALTHLMLEDAEAALRDVAAAETHGGPTPLLHFIRGTIHVRGQALAAAVAEFDAALRLHPDFVEALSERGLARAALGDRAGALADLDAVLARTPSDHLTWTNRGGLHAEGRQYAAAADDYARALELAPADWDQRAVVIRALAEARRAAAAGD